MITLPYNTLKLLGWITVTLVLLSSIFYLLIFVSKNIHRHDSNKTPIRLSKIILKKALPFIRSYHPVFGTAALIAGVIHGYSLLQAVEFHSGFILWFFILLMGLTGISMKLLKSRTKYKFMRKLHKTIMFIALGLMIFHVIMMKFNI